MSSKKNLKAPTPKPKSEFSNSKESLTRRPIGSQRKKETEENFEKPKTKRLDPDISESENENESDTVEENHDKELPKKSTRNTILKCLFYFANYKILLFCAMLIFLIYIYVEYVSNLHQKVPHVETEISVAEVIKDLENHFKNQHERTYGLLKSELKKVVSQTAKPTAPAIITLIASEGSELTASEFSQRLIRKLAPETHLLINESKYWDDEPDNIRLKIDEEIRSFAEGDHLSIIVVDKVEKIPFRAAMIFHSYCDHEAAPYKRAIFLFIVPANKDIPVNAKIKEIDQIAMDRLKNIWHEASGDKIDSLITRLTVSVVSVR